MTQNKQYFIDTFFRSLTRPTLTLTLALGAGLGLAASVAQADSREPAGTGYPQSTSASTAGDFHVRGFMDAQWAMIKNDHYNSGGYINDGALYFTYAKDGADVLIDVPFLSSTATKVQSASDTPSKDFTFGWDKAQAVASYTFAGPKTKISFGQFDTIVGFELNDSADVFFSKQGLVFSGLLPTTHTGFMLTQPLMDMLTIRVLASNGASYAKEFKMKNEYGLGVGFNSNMFRFGVNALVESKEHTGASSRNYMLIDVLAGMTMDMFSVDAEYVSRDPGGAEALSETGFLLEPVVKIMPELSVGLRLEMLNNYKAKKHSVQQMTAGLQYKIAEPMTIKFDYTWTKDVADTDHASDTDSSSTAGMLSAVFKI